MIQGINHITLAVRDLEQSFQFYDQILGFKPLALRKNKSAYFLCGTDWIVLVQNQNKEIQSPNQSYTHYAFSVETIDFEHISRKIKKSGATIWQENSSPGESLYFLDPSGHKLEVHTGNWKTRIQWLKDNPSEDVHIF